MKYLLAIFGEEGDQQTQMSAEDMTAMVKTWSDFGAGLTNAGVYLAGEGLQPSSTATTVEHAAGGERLVTDGPFAETKEQIGGFYLLDCANLDDALNWAKQVPVGEGGSIEVRPVMDFTQFGYEDPSAA